ncbi:hypothetical protein TU52_29300 [Bacillus cereus]|nr:hypothetical protein TU52_29300 [Bacillus cereus]
MKGSNDIILKICKKGLRKELILQVIIEKFHEVPSSDINCFYPFFEILQFCKVTVRKFDGNKLRIPYNEGNNDKTRRKK